MTEQTSVSLYFPGNWTQNQCFDWLNERYKDFALYMTITDQYCAIIDQEHLTWIRAEAKRIGL